MIEQNILDNLHRHEVVAVEVPSAHTGRRAWVAVVAYQHISFGPPPPNFHLLPWNYLIRWVEVDVQFVGQPAYDLPIGAMEIIRETIVEGEELLDKVLTEWISDPNRLDYGFRCNLPPIWG